jgi:hypothetical protein
VKAYKEANKIANERVAKLEAGIICMRVFDGIDPFEYTRDFESTTDAKSRKFANVSHLICFGWQRRLMAGSIRIPAVPLSKAVGVAKRERERETARRIETHQHGWRLVASVNDGATSIAPGCFTMNMRDLVSAL